MRTWAELENKVVKILTKINISSVRSTRAVVELADISRSQRNKRHSSRRN
jgi:hypothetical protein